MILTAEGGEVEVACIDLAVSEAQYEGFWPLLSDAERVRSKNFVNAAHGRAFAVTRGTLRRLLAERLQVDPAELDIEETANGKPMLGEPWAALGLHFNLSHSGDLAVFAFARRSEIGIDIEVLRDLPDAVALAKRFFSPAETAALSALGAEDRQRAFFACWTRKEAFVKALGLGLTFPFREFSVTTNPEGDATLTALPASAGKLSDWTMIGFQPRPNYLGAVVFRSS
ncbi:MAG: 4'-phosphopantetheinyl transferase family protein [Hyphomicrobium sp.]